MSECTKDNERYSINPMIPKVEKNEKNEKNKRNKRNKKKNSSSRSWYDAWVSNLRSDFTTSLKFLIIYLGYWAFTKWAWACIGIITDFTDKITEESSKHPDDVFYRPVFFSMVTIFFPMAFLFGQFFLNRIVHTINQLYKWRFNSRFRRHTCTNIDDMMDAVETIFNLHTTQLDNDGKRNIETYKLLIPFIQANGWLGRDILDVT